MATPTFVAVTAVNGGGTTSTTVAYPAGISYGDLLIIAVTAKLSTVTFPAITGWTLQKDFSVGSGTPAAGVGPQRMAVYTRIADGTETGSVTITPTGGSAVVLGGMSAYRSSLGGWSLDMAFGDDTSSSTAFSATLDHYTGLAATGDLVFYSIATSSNSNHGSSNFVQPGASTGTLTERSDAGTTTGQSVRLSFGDRPITAGAGNAIGRVDSTTGTATTGGAIVIRMREASSMPVGNLTNWTQTFTQDFTTTAAIGAVGTVYGTDMRGYSGFQDTFSQGTYLPDNVLSVPASSSYLDYYIHTVSGVHRVAAPVPMGYTGQTYGRYSLRFRADNLPGYKIAFLLWPSSDVWDEGEIDWPEQNLDTGQVAKPASAMKGTYHPTLFNIAFDPPDRGQAPNDASLFHVATVEWTPGLIIFYWDGLEVDRTTVPQKVPTTPMRWTLQAESASTTAPPDATAGHIQVDWAVAYAYTGPDTTPTIPTSTEAFTGTSGAWPAQWLTTVNGGTLDLSSNTGRMLPSAGGYTMGPVALLNQGPYYDQEFYGEIQLTSNAEKYAQVILRAGESIPTYFPLDGYQLSLAPSTGAYTVDRANGGGTPANLATVTHTYTASTVQKVRFRIVERTLSYKVWQSGTTEPGSWDGTFTDDSIQYLRSGFLQLTVQSGAGAAQAITWDNVSVTPILPAPATSRITEFRAQVGSPSSARLTEFRSVVNAQAQTATVALVQSSSMGLSGALTTKLATVPMVQSSSMGVTAQRSAVATVALSQTSTVAVTGLKAISTVVALAQSSTMTLSAATFTANIGTVPLVQSSTMSVTPLRSAVAAVALAGGNVLSVSGFVTRSATLALAQSSSLAVTGTRSAVAAVILTQSSAMAVDEFQGIPGTIALGQSSSISVTGTTVGLQSATVAMVSSSNLGVSGFRAMTQAVTLVQSNTISVAGYRTALSTIPLAQSSSLAVSGFRETTVSVALAQSSSLVVSGLKSIAGTVSLGQSSTLAVTPLRTSFATVAMASSSSMTVTGSRTIPVTVAMVGANDLDFGEDLYVIGQIALAGSNALSVAVAGTQTATIALIQSSAMTVAGFRAFTTTVTLSSSSSLSVATVQSRTAAVALVSSSSLAVSALRTTSAAIALISSSTFSITGSRIAVATVSMTGTSDLDVSGTQTTIGGVALVQSSAIAIDSQGTNTATVTMTGTGSLAVTTLLTRVGIRAMIQSSTLSLAGSLTKTATVSLVQSGTMAVATAIARVGQMNLTGANTVSLTVSGSQSSAVTLSSSSAISISAALIHPAAIAMVASNTLALAAGVSRSLAVALASSSSVTIAGTLVHTSVLTIAGSNAVTVSSGATQLSTIAMSHASALALSARSVQTAIMVIGGFSSLSVIGRATHSVAVGMSSSSTLALTPTTIRLGTLALTNASALAVAGRNQDLAFLAMIGTSVLDADVEIGVRPDYPDVIDGPYSYPINLEGPYSFGVAITGPQSYAESISGPWSY